MARSLTCLIFQLRVDQRRERVLREPRLAKDCEVLLPGRQGAVSFREELDRYSKIWAEEV